MFQNQKKVDQLKLGIQCKNVLTNFEPIYLNEIIKKQNMFRKLEHAYACVQVPHWTYICSSSMLSALVSGEEPRNKGRPGWNNNHSHFCNQKTYFGRSQAHRNHGKREVSRGLQSPLFLLGSRTQNSITDLNLEVVEVRLNYTYYRYSYNSDNSKLGTFFLLKKESGLKNGLNKIIPLIFVETVKLIH